MFKQAIWGLLLAVLLLGVPRLAAVFADLFDYAAVDPDGAFAWVSVGHIFQAVVFLVLMLVISRWRAIRFGFGWGNRLFGWFYVRVCALIFSAYIVVSLLIIVMAGSFQTLPYPMTARNIAGFLGFQLLLSGPSEELTFRAFAMTILALSVNGAAFSRGTGVGKAVLKILGGELSTANSIAAIIFGLAHVRFTLVPF